MRRIPQEYHHLDANVLLGALVPTDERLRMSCKEYLDKLLGHTYRAGVSIHILGEVHKKIQEDLSKDRTARNASIEFLDRLISKGEVSICTLTDEDLKLFHELREIETRADAPELLALCVAIREGAHVFMTADTKLDNEKLRSHIKKYSISIKHPSQA